MKRIYSLKNKNQQHRNPNVNSAGRQKLHHSLYPNTKFPTKLVMLLPLMLFLLFGESSGQPVYGPPSCRNVHTWPYAQSSIWNTPIGSGANYSPQPVNPNHIDGIQSDLDIIVLTPEASDMNIYGTKYRWQSGTNSDTRCEKYNDIVHLSLPIPDDYVTLFYKQSRPNNAGCIMKKDGRTLVQIQPFQACGGGYATSGLKRQDGQVINELLRTEDIDIYGDGRKGMHGGSGLNTMGGAIRLGELTSPNVDAMRHAIKISLPGEHYLYYDHSNNTGHRWPATQHDSGAENDYNGSNTHALQGCLRALKPDLNIEDLNLETLPGKKIAWTLQNYGAYQVEGVPWARMMIAVEEGPNGAVVTEFKNTYGYDFVSQDKSGNPWVRDLLKIAEHLHVVTNNYEVTPGGGGTPLQPLAPGFCNGTEPPSTEQSPFAEHNIPGSIEAEDYDNGGQGVAYNDIDAGNNGGQYRSDGVDIQSTSNNGGGYNVGWTANGEWLEYTISSVSGGTYDISFDLASNNTTTSKSLTLILDGNILGTISPPFTGGWQEWQMVTLSGVNISQGTDVILRLDIGGGNFNVDNIVFTQMAPDTTPPASPANLSATANDGSINLNWDDNGESDLAGYNLYRSISSDGSYIQINGSLVSNSNYTDNSVSNGTTYYYLVTAEDHSGNESSYSSMTSATPVELSVVVAINAGGNSFTDSDGLQYEGDNYFSGGGIYSSSDGITGTIDDVLYQTERFGDFSYNIPVSNGDYEVTFKFAEIFHNSPNNRIFDVSAEGIEIISNLDIFATVGHDAVLDITIPVSVSDGILNISFSTDVDNAKVSSIIVESPSGGVSDTTPPASPANLSATAHDGSISLIWNDNSENDLAGYNVYRSISSGGSYTKTNVSLVSTTNYTDNSVSNGTTYFYVVTAEDDSGNESEYSSEVSATPESGSILYEENFDGSLSNWIEVPDSRWFVNDNSYKHIHESGAGNDYAFYDGQLFSDYTYFVEIIPSWNNNFGVIFNLQDGNNYYLLDIDTDPKDCQLKKIVNGNTSTIASSTYSGGGQGQLYTIEVYDDGINITVKINGSEVFSNVNDNSFSNGKIGLWASFNPLSVDNIMVVSGQVLSLKSTPTDITKVKGEEVPIKVNVFPNPVGAGKDITILVNNLSNSASMVLYDNFGNKLYQTEIVNGINTIPGDKLENGMYVIRIIEGLTSISHKVIVGE